MFCMNCGKQIRDGSLFCPYCGQRTTVPTIMDSDAGQHVRNLPEAGGMPLYEQSVERNQSQTEKKQSLWNKSRGFRWRILLVVGIAFAILVFVVESFSMLSHLYSLHSPIPPVGFLGGVRTSFSVYFRPLSQTPEIKPE